MSEPKKAQLSQAQSEAAFQAQRDKQLLTLKTYFKNSLKTLSLPEHLIDDLENISSEDPEERSKFIEDKIKKPLEAALKNLKAGEFCLTPSLHGPNNFNIYLKINDHSKKLIGAIKGDYFEVTDYEGNVVKAKNLDECLEKIIFSFEKHFLIPTVFDSHRQEVMKNRDKTLIDAFENHQLNRVQQIFSYLDPKEMDEETLLIAFEKGSESIITLIINEINANQLSIKTIIGNKNRNNDFPEKISKILEIAANRASRGDEHNQNIAARLREYLKQQYPHQINRELLEQEKRKDKFYQALYNLHLLKPTASDFQTKREQLEQIILQSLEYFNANNTTTEVINQKMGVMNLNPLDIILAHGSQSLLKEFLKAGAEPTVGWQNETLENFKSGMRSAVNYIIARSARTSQEKHEISAIIEDYLSPPQKPESSRRARKI